MKLRNVLPALVLAGLPLLAGAADEKSAESSYVALSELVAKVHARSGRQFILDPAAAGMRISLAGMDVEKIDYPMLLVVLRYNGLVTVAEKEAVSILPDSFARQLPTPVLSADDPKVGDETVITRLVPVRNVCAAQLVPVLRPLMPQSAHMAAHHATNTLILADHADNIRRIVDIVERIDKAAPPGKQNCEPSKLGS